MKILAAVLLAAAGAAFAAEATVRPVDDDNAVKFAAYQGPVLLYFYNQRCLICKQTLPVISAFACEYGKDLTVAKTEIFHKPDHWTEKWKGLTGGKIEQVPTIVLVNKGAEVKRFSAANLTEGGAQKDALRVLVEKLLGVSKRRKDECWD